MILQKKYWPICLLLNIITFGLFNFIIAAYLDLYDKNAWYNKKWYWIGGTICLIFPVFIMLMVFLIQMIVNIAKKLEVRGSDIYATPYSWIVCMIVPIVGWVCLLVMLFYIMTFTIVKLGQGKGEEIWSV